VALFIKTPDDEQKCSESEGYYENFGARQKLPPGFINVNNAYNLIRIKKYADIPHKKDGMSMKKLIFYALFHMLYLKNK